MRDPQIITGVIAGSFLLLGTMLAAGFTAFNSWLTHRRNERTERQKAINQERAVLNGAFALSNFINARLNDWDKSNNIHDLIRLTVAQPYLTKLIDRAPPDSERLMVSLIDVGLRLEALLFALERAVDREFGIGTTALKQIESNVEELSTAIELVDLIVTGELPFISDVELAELSDHADRIDIDDEKLS